MGFSLRDIDIVLISHDHPDHLRDFETIVHLLRELEDKYKILHRVNVLLTLASYRRLAHIITRPNFRRHINSLVIDIEKEVNPKGEIEFIFERCGEKNDGDKQGPLYWQPVLSNNVNGEYVSVKCTLAYHDDYSNRSDSYGFILNFVNWRSAVKESINSKSKNSLMSPTLSFGYTGDTKWVGPDLYGKGCPLYSEGRCGGREHESENDKKKCGGWNNVGEQYKDCDVLLLHLGSLIDHKRGMKFSNYQRQEDCEELIRDKNHPYLMGMIRLLADINKESRNKNILYLLSEFGEELRGGIRKDLVNRFQRGFNGESNIIPVDVGLDVRLWEKIEQTEELKQGSNDKENTKCFHCELCDQYRSVKDVAYLNFGQDEAIYHVCRTCEKSLPHDVQQNKIRQLYDIGRELRTLPNVIAKK
jgi:hypothetical protein